jgi:hypothetical protein
MEMKRRYFANNWWNGFFVGQSAKKICENTIKKHKKDGELE